MKKTAFVRIVTLMVVAVLVVTVSTGCKAKTGTLNWGTDPTYAPFETDACCARQMSRLPSMLYFLWGLHKV